jgi:hypothetical protein
MLTLGPANEAVDNPIIAIATANKYLILFLLIVAGVIYSVEKILNT